ncbi:uncharacterized protein LOC132753943 [Ruditapes philippinarum]|uniref:uncharacterized protein LOC132753943 n=1 Tax=Ruditapes philippinarum TaxID=129788 RepID=UPI00295BB0BB|nr:uncharacterized protein LOC132753943 [Ruditapes philippinarum]
MFKKYKIHIFGTLLIVLDGSWGYTRMEDYCSNEISFIAYTVYQTQLQLTDNNLFEKRNPNHPYDRLGYCETTVKGWYTSFNKLMFYFEDINLDCDKGHLEFYAGERSYARIEGLEVDVCGKSKPEGAFTADSQYIRIKYVPVKYQIISNVVSIVITSFGYNGRYKFFVL